MEFLIEALAAVLLVWSGALISGGLSLPQARTASVEQETEDDFGKDLAALLGYQAEREEEDA